MRNTSCSAWSESPYFAVGAAAEEEEGKEREKMETARTVKDVSPHEFVKAYAAHLKRSGKVCVRFLLGG